ncbi:MAG: response regulator [Candidatus Saccharibacteria bacterium]|nr:response regulator [Pseudorhodobacter sp.]
MRKSAELPNLMLAAIGAGTWDLDLETNILSHSEMFSKISGINDNLTEHSFPLTSYHIHPEDIGGVLQKVASAVETGSTYLANYRLCREDGSVIWVEGLGRVIERDAEGRAKRMVGALRDVTDAVTTRQKLSETEANFAELVESVPGAIVRCSRQLDGTTIFSYVGPKCRDIWGLTAAEIMADPSRIWDMAISPDAETLKAAFSPSDETIEALDAKVHITTASGRRKRIHLLAAPQQQSDAAMTRTVLILDITEQTRIEDELRKSREIILQTQKIEAIGSLTGGMAHDFNNLLAVILGNLELLQEDSDPDAMENYITEAVTATLRGRDLIRSLLSFARKAPLAPVTMNLNDVARGLDQMIRRTVPENIDIEIVPSCGLWKLQADRSLTESMILNLVINARDAMHEAGKITIETANIRLTEEYVDVRGEAIDPGRYVMIAVTDTGEGIAPENLERVFEPFFTTKPVGKGTGLGLSSVMGFARQSGGTVRIYSELGVGTTVKVYFRAVFQHDENQPLVTEALPIAPHRGKLLLVEDEIAVRKVLKARLQIEGYTVIEAENAAHAMHAYETEAPFDLILTDIVMPGGMQGNALVKALRVINPDLKAIFMSGYPNEVSVHGLRADDIKLMKPVTKNDLLRALKRVLGPYPRSVAT